MGLLLSRKNIIRLIVVLAILPLIITQTGCSKSVNKNEAKPVEQEGYYLDTVCKISVYDMDGGMTDKKANAAIDKAYDRCRELDKKLSNTVDVSDISKINNSGGQWTEVGPDALTVIKGGIKYGDLSGGDFDITIGTVSDLWDYHSDHPKVPSQDKINEALTHVNYKNIQIQGNSVRLSDPKSKIDLGGIAKGYIADQVADTLQNNGVTSAVVNLGGNIVTIGSKPDGTDFTIGIEKPYSDRSELIGKTEISSGTVVTSGVYERQFKYKGKVYHHILSPRTGYPVDTDLDSITLMSTRGMSMDTDALSTICLIKGKDEALKLINSRDDTEAVLCTHDGKVYKSKDARFQAE